MHEHDRKIIQKDLILLGLNKKIINILNNEQLGSIYETLKIFVPVFEKPKFEIDEKEICTCKEPIPIWNPKEPENNVPEHCYCDICCKNLKTGESEYARD